MPLYERISFHLGDGSKLRFITVSDGSYSDRRCLEQADPNVVNAVKHAYRCVFEKPEARHPGIAYLCDALQEADESGYEDVTAARQKVGDWEVLVDLDGLSEEFELPACTGWPERPPQRPLMYEGTEIEYGDNDLDGIRDSLGEAFWTLRYDEE
eukprot:TRINITY_DN94838_c0_g1_i1.p1 TRINITY_DN94838_c0_g1~~TRINITY_DN94838_c0_g1_i1.p1  ORF type:complete len:171 (-),score=36.49 TRINITY_DN94838_c0_g1_i1:510-971(-)